MRQFLVIGHDAPTAPDFSLDDLAGAAGRLDVLCRSVTSALLRSHGVREDTRVFLTLDDSLTLRFDGSEIRRLNPDERSTAARIRDALDSQDAAVGHVPAEPAPGVAVFRGGVETALDVAAAEKTLVCHGDGLPVVDYSPVEDALFVLSDHHDFTDADLSVLKDRADGRVCLGPVALHADQAITVAHNWLDTHGYERY